MTLERELETMVIEPLERLDRDLRMAAKELSPAEARYLVDLYYQVQDYRKRASSQDKAMDKAGEPHELTEWVFGAVNTLENDIKRALDTYSGSQVPGIWARTIPGVGPVISAGLLAHIDITKAPTVGHIWRFAGQDPTVKWEKKTKRPWNAELKVLCWKIGESFVKVCNSEKDIYGHIYAARKELEQSRNEQGLFAGQAASALAAKKYRADTEAYKWYTQGFLPPAHIHSRAKRYAVKLFLAHYHHVAYEVQFGVPPPKPYVIEHLGHVDYIKPPNWPM
jgi:hypothetical protein